MIFIKLFINKVALTQSATLTFLCKGVPGCGRRSTRITDQVWWRTKEVFEKEL